MLNVLKKIITGKTVAPGSPANPDQRSHIAACVLLLETAHIDNDCTQEEMTHLVKTLAVKFSLSPDHAEELVSIADQARREAVDLWQFTNHLNQHCTPAEKTAIMEDIWRIIHIDGRLEQHEDHFSHKIANLLRLSHQQLIDAKLKARQQLQGCPATAATSNTPQ